MTQAILIILILLLAWVYSGSWATFAIISIIGIMGVTYLEPKLYSRQ